MGSITRDAGPVGSAETQVRKVDVMTTSPHAPSPAAPVASAPGGTAVASQPLRLSIAEDPHGPVDGAWWPRSRDLVTEVADLVDHFPVEVGRLDRLLFSRPDWDDPEGVATPRRVRAARGMVKTGSFPSDDTHLVVAKLSSGRRVRLVVVPPGTSESEARAVMTAAGGPDNHRTARELLGLDTDRPDDLGHHAWDDDSAGATP